MHVQALRSHIGVRHSYIRGLGHNSGRCPSRLFIHTFDHKGGKEMISIGLVGVFCGKVVDDYKPKAMGRVLCFHRPAATLVGK
jgi:hypothetical protein